MPFPNKPRTRVTGVHWLIVLAVLGTTMFGFVPFAEAHTDFESSTPADGATLDQPVSEIRLRFSAASIVAGDGFVVLTPSGELVQPEIRISEDEREFALLFDPALTDGVVGVQWSVRAGDAHPIEGTFSFTTNAAAVVIDPVASEQESVEVAAAPSTDQASVAETVPAGAGAEAGAIDSTTQVAPGEGTDVTAVAEATSPEASAGVNVPGVAVQSAPTAAAVSMEDFLNTETGSGAAGLIGYVGRLASQAGSLFTIGVIGFVVLVSKKDADQTMFVLLIRQAAALTLIGAVVRVIGLVAEVGSFTEALISTTGLAVGLRAAGAAALLIASASLGQVAVPQVAERALATVGGGSFSGAIGSPRSEFTRPAASLPTPPRSKRIGATEIGWAAVIALSFVFDGHTVSKGNHLLTGLVAVIHVVGGAVWLGGLICLVLLSRRRSSQADGSDFMATVVRFSVVAAVALVAVGAAGLALTITILDSVSELWSTAWGRILIAKVLIVAVAAAAGAFNHYVLVPEMQSVSAHRDARQSFVRTMVIELVAIGGAVALTAVLVVAAS